MVQFILGRSGSGKTTLCIREITECLLEDEPRQSIGGANPNAAEPCHSDGRANPNPTEPCHSDGRANRNLVFLVPEQATYQAERAILSDNRIKGYSRLHILSFQRLCYMIFGKNLAARPLTTQGRDMIVHRLLCEMGEKLSVFRTAAQKYGTAERLANTIAELQQHSKSPDDVGKIVERLKSTSELTGGKLADINLIYKQYLAFVEGNFLNNDNQLNLARESVARTPFLKDCQLWVDGFAGFTTSEMLLLTELLKVSLSSKIALCIDPNEPRQSIGGANPNPAEPAPRLRGGKLRDGGANPNSVTPGTGPGANRDWTGIFEPTEKTYTELGALIKNLKLPVEKPVVLKDAKRFEKSKALAHLERNIFSFDKLSPVSAQGSIKIAACAKKRLEVDYVARQICSLVKDKGFRWRDIAVIASDLDAYRHYIQAVFCDFDIPFFIDRRRDLQQYPAVELITSALKIATDRFTTNDVINYLKSDLVPVSRTEVDELENYCLAFGIEAEDWLSREAWDFASADDSDFNNEKIEGIRGKAAEHLLGLRALLGGGAVTAERFCREIFGFLDRLNVRGQLAAWTKAAFEEKRLDEAQLHQQFFAQWTQLMDDFAYIFKDSSLSAKQYASIISSAFSQMTVALIPPALDQVLVGSIERSRHPDLKAVFLIGATQQQFPMPVYYDNILNDSDRKAAADSGFELARSGAMQLIERRYLAYIAFTRPSRFLYITYPLTDEKGSQVQSSFLVSQLRALFNDLEEEKYFGSSESFADILNKSDLSGLLASRLGRDNLSPIDETDAKCKWLLDNAPKDYELAGVKAAIDYKNAARLENAAAQKVLRTSATRLRSFANCPYQHFARYVLEMKERRLAKLKPLDLGLFFHSVLELLFNKLKSNNLSFSTVNSELLGRFVDDSVKKLLVENSFLKNFAARARHNSFIILSAAEVIKDAASELSQIARIGSFAQIACEIGFGDEFSVPAVEIKLDGGEKMHIEGKIDRVDTACKDGKNYALILDYKTSQSSIDFSMLSAGLDLQLPIYLLAVRNRTIGGYGGLVPLGAFYFRIQASPRSADLGGIEKEAGKIKRKPKGFFNGEFFKLIDGKTETGHSPFYSFQITQKDKQFGRYETSSLLTEKHFSGLLSFTENKIREFGGRIISGAIDVNPYKYGKRIACTYCPYKPLCRFDWQINDYAQVKKISKTEFFGAIE